MTGGADTAHRRDSPYRYILHIYVMYFGAIYRGRDIRMRNAVHDIVVASAPAGAISMVLSHPASSVHAVNATQPTQYLMKHRQATPRVSEWPNAHTRSPYSTPGDHASSEWSDEVAELRGDGGPIPAKQARPTRETLWRYY